MNNAFLSPRVTHFMGSRPKRNVFNLASVSESSLVVTPSGSAVGPVPEADTGCLGCASRANR